MSRWSSRLSRRGGSADHTAPGAGHASATVSASVSASASGPRAAAAAPPVEDIDGVLLVRSVDDDSFPMAALAEVAHTFGAEADTVTVLVGSADPDGGRHWPRLAALLDSLRDRGTRRVRLVLSGAGAERPGRPSTARRIADDWGFEVLAPDGVVLITPGGSLFVRGDVRGKGNWWRFAPGEPPAQQGPRAPVPDWQRAVGRVPERTSGGCVVEQIPAGVLIRPADAAGPRPDDLSFAVPLDPGHATVLVGTPHAEDVAADEVAAVLAALPAEHRARARLAPGGLVDLLRLTHAVADALGDRVDVLTGLPLLADHAPPGAPPRPTLIGRDGEPTWQPYVTAVACLPTPKGARTPLPRLLGSHTPDWLPAGTEPGTVRLTDGWQAVVTRSGLALWAQGAPRPPLVGTAVDPETCAVELGAPGQQLDSSLLSALARLLTGLGAAGRARTTLLVRGRPTGGEADLRRLAAEHGVRGIRYVTASGPAPHPPAPAKPRPAPEGPHHRTTTHEPLTPTPALLAYPAPELKPTPTPDGVRQLSPGPASLSAPDSGRVPGPAGDLAPAPDPTPGAGLVPVPDGVRQSSSGPASLSAPDGGPVAGSAGDLAPAPDPTPGAGLVPVPDGVRQLSSGPASLSAPDPTPGTGSRPGPALEPRPESGPEAGPGEASALDRAVRAGSVPGLGSEPEPEVGPGEAPAPDLASVSGPAADAASGAGPTPDSASVSAPVRIPSSAAPAMPRVGREAAPGPGPRTAAERVGAVGPLGEGAAVGPGYVSRAGERAGFRGMAGGEWERHARGADAMLAAVAGLRGDEREAARADLAAVHAYLTAEEGPLHHRELVRGLRAGEERLRPYAACVASGLRRLPSYRGIALRGGAADGGGPEAGALLHDPAPVAALTRPPAGDGALPPRYAIWSSAGRRTPDGIVFAPGTGFRVLGTWKAPAGTTVVLLRELPAHATAYMDGARELSPRDLAALGHLKAVLDAGLPAGAERSWPERCAGPVGGDGQPPPTHPPQARPHPRTIDQPEGER
ncbi:hypothetical protein [Actinacidiphila alni]|uniref:hypothetical protein n=1 Tax=Actinacidiphila alni TaxID=380248 RepID=UPI0034543B2F